MPIHITARSIAIATVSICCDLCDAQIEPLGEILTATISRISVEPQRLFLGTTEGLFEIPGIPRTQDAGTRLALERGWSLENVHKKSLLVCPGCKVK